MDTEKGSIESMLGKIGELAETKVELLKLKAVKKTADTMASVMVGLIAGIFALAALTMLSIGAAFWIGRLLGNVAAGFFIMGGAYLLIGSIIYFFWKKGISAAVQNGIIRKMANS